MNIWRSFFSFLFLPVDWIAADESKELLLYSNTLLPDRADSIILCDVKNSIGVIAKCDNLYLCRHQSNTMAKKSQALPVADETVLSKILLVRGKKVMIDRDLAELYGVTTMRLNEQVKRNKKRFPEDFMFQVTKEEKQQLIDRYPHLAKLKFSPTLPYVFTEHGAVMLASVLNSERAIAVNIQIVRVFSRMREVLLTHKDILVKLEQVEKKLLRQDMKMNKYEEDIQLIFETLKELLNPPAEPRQRIGFRRSTEED